MEQAPDEYEQEVRDAPLRAATQQTYLTHARNFDRWLRGDFEPGVRGRR